VRTSKSGFVPYARIRSDQSNGPLRQSEIPIQHALSLPLPTRRFGPGFALFASPALREPGKPTVQSPPDRWWVVDAKTGHLTLYARVASVPFCEEPFPTLTLPIPTATVTELRESSRRLNGLMDPISVAFFAGEPAPAEMVGDLKGILTTMLPTPLLQQHRALAQDFFRWMEWA